MRVEVAVLGCPVRPNEPYGFRGPKATLNHASALVSACPQYVNRHPRTLSNTTEPRPLYLLRVVVPLDEPRTGREDLGHHRLQNQSPWTLCNRSGNDPDPWWKEAHQRPSPQDGIYALGKAHMRSTRSL